MPRLPIEQKRQFLIKAGWKQETVEKMTELLIDISIIMFYTKFKIRK